MTAKDVYDEIKATLKYFDLQFGHMDEIDFKIGDGEFIMTYQNRSVIVTETE